MLGLLAVAALSAGVAATMIVRDGSGASGAGLQLSSGEVRDAADAFAGAIGSEDAGALSRVLARDVKRVFPGDSQRGRAAVLATYRGQFRGNEITGYELSDLDVSGGRDGRAAGTYELRRGGRDATGGRIVLGVKRERGQAKVALIAAEPNYPAAAFAVFSVTLLPGSTTDPAGGSDSHTRRGPERSSSNSPPTASRLTSRPSASSLEAASSSCTPVRSGTVTRGSKVTRRAANAAERPGIDALTSITLTPSSSFTVALNAPLETAAASPSTSTEARAGETRPRSSTLSSLTVEVSAGASIVSRTAAGSGAGRSSAAAAGERERGEEGEGGARHGAIEATGAGVVR